MDFENKNVYIRGIEDSEVTEAWVILSSDLLNNHEKNEALGHLSRIKLKRWSIIYLFFFLYHHSCLIDHHHNNFYPTLSFPLIGIFYNLACSSMIGYFSAVC